MDKPQYKFIPVREETHHLTKLGAAKRGMIFDEYQQHLLSLDDEV